MTTSTRRTLRDLVIEFLGGGNFLGLTTSSAGAAAGATLVDTALKGYDDDMFKGWFAILPLGPLAAGSGSYEAQEVDTFTFAAGTVTPVVAFSAQVESAAVYDLSRYDPALLHRCINRAVEDFFPFIYVAKRDETLVVDQRLTNGDIESTIVSGAHPSWTNVNSPTVTTETSLIWHGSQSAKIVSHASTGAGQMTQAPTINIHEVTGRGVFFTARVYATEASVARIRLDWDGTNFVNHAYHSGKDQWEYQSILSSVPSTATQVKAILEVLVGTKTAYFDNVVLAVGTIYRYTIPAAIIRGPMVLSMQRDINHPDGPFDTLFDWEQQESAGTRYIVLRSALSPGRILRVEGQGMLAKMTADTGTTEVVAPRTHLIAARACQYLFEQLAADSFGPEGQEYTAKARDWAARVEEYKRQPGVRSRRMAVAVDLPWSTG